MIDPNFAVLTWLQSSPALVALVGSNIFSPDLPEGFSAMASEAPDPAQRAVVVRKRGGHSEPEVLAVLDPSFAVECWAMEAPDATQIYGVIRDLMHGATSIDLGSAGFVILCQEEVPGQDVTDPETHWAMVFAYYHVKLRGSTGVMPPQGGSVTLYNLTPSPDGTVTTFTAPVAISPNALLFLDGQLMTAGEDYSYLGAVVTFFIAPDEDSVIVLYQ